MCLSVFLQGRYSVSSIFVQGCWLSNELDKARLGEYYVFPAWCLLLSSHDEYDAVIVFGRSVFTPTNTHNHHQPGMKNHQVASKFSSEWSSTQTNVDLSNVMISKISKISKFRPLVATNLKMLQDDDGGRVVVACCYWLEIERYDRWWWLTAGDTSVIRVTPRLPPAQSGLVSHYITLLSSAVVINILSSGLIIVGIS